MARNTAARMSGPAGILAAILLAGCGPTSVEEEAVPAETGPARIKPVDKLVEEEAAGTFVLRINCGSDADYEDPDGNIWKADRPFEEGGWGYEGGRSITRREDTEIERTELDPLYRTERYSLRRYRITVPNGRYSVALHMAETFWQLTRVGERVYHIDIEGRQLLPDFDPIEAAGGSACTAVVKTFDVEVTDGELTVGFTPKVENPMMNGIEVVAK